MQYYKPELKVVGLASALVLGSPLPEGDNVGDPIRTQQVSELVAGLDD